MRMCDLCKKEKTTGVLFLDMDDVKIVELIGIVEMFNSDFSKKIDICNNCILLYLKFQKENRK